MGLRGGFGRAKKPQNVCLIASNAALLTACIVGFSATIVLFEQTRDDLSRLHHTMHIDASPCALATPSTALLSIAVGHTDNSVWSSVPSESKVARDFQLGLCGSSSVYSFLAYATKNWSMVHTADEKTNPLDPDTWDTAEASFLDALCNEDTEEDVFGDVRQRIARAYLHANAAFVRLATGCAFVADPFSLESCAQSSFVKGQLTEAAKDTAAGGFGEAPDTGLALYRLVALSVAAYYDRSLNSNGCFGNTEGTNASHFCWTTYEERPIGFNGESSTKEVVLPGEPGYEAIARTQSTCAARGGAVFDSPSPPPVPEWVYPENQWTASYPEIVSCSHALEYGLLDQRRLFGVPDPSGTFQVETAEFPWFSNLLYDREGLSKLDDGFTLPHVRFDRRSRLLVYACYRLLAVTVYCMLTNSVLGFFFGFSVVSLVMYVTSHILGWTQSIVQIRPPPGPAFFVAVAVGVFAWFWGTFVDGAWHRSPFYVSADCGSWASAVQVSSPFLTTDGDHRGERSWRAWLTLIVTAYSALYMFAFRAWGRIMKKRFKTESRALQPRTPVTTLATIMATSMCVVLMIIVQESKNRWVDRIITSAVTTGKIPTDELTDLENDLWVAIITPLFLGYAVGAMTQRWAVEKGSNLFSRFPWFASIGVAIFFPFTLIWWTYADAKTRQNDTDTRATYSGVFTALTLATEGLLLIYALPIKDVEPGGSGGAKMTVNEPSSSDGSDSSDSSSDDDSSTYSGAQLPHLILNTGR